ncbi:MAG: KH domain-containing protein [Pseudanabaenaceae cyanobacterium bins.39]|nr:KH domain-containing protein [Pseudanabaenaceae cyanobacterium bins.39]
MPDYNALISFLLKPLLTQPDALRVDFESNGSGDRVWIRVAFAEEDRGIVFGKWGRTIQAVRTIVMATAEEANHSAKLEVFDPHPHSSDIDSHSKSSDISQPRSPRPVLEKPKRKDIN